MNHPFLAAVTSLALLACSSAKPAGTGSTAGGTGGSAGDAVIGGDARPVTVFVPSSYDVKKPVPLVLLLHAFTLTGATQEAYMKFEPVAEARGFLYAHPDGTRDPDGNPFWNATDGCCAPPGSTVDDSAYLESVIKQIEARYSVDPKRIYLTGHSNGGFMSYRMACDHADTIAAIASIGAAMWKDTSKCKPSEPVSVLEIHGTKDEYDGSMVPGLYPGALTTVEDWVKFDGCDDAPDTSLPPLDLDLSIPGPETTIKAWSKACKPGGHAELWTANGAGHVPLPLSPQYASHVVDFLFAHPKP